MDDVGTALADEPGGGHDFAGQARSGSPDGGPSVHLRSGLGGVRGQCAALRAGDDRTQTFARLRSDEIGDNARDSPFHRLNEVKNCQLALLSPTLLQHERLSSYVDRRTDRESNREFRLSNKATKAGLNFVRKTVGKARMGAPVRPFGAAEKKGGRPAMARLERELSALRETTHRVTASK
ncbi:hypothetical protein GCM10010353_43860 [Streptomyces chryseus]|nr:hypothetical protein GCM10010353_43860 [Streptomyces chryseus]